MIVGVLDKSSALRDCMVAGHYLMSERLHAEAIERARKALRTSRRRLREAERRAREARARVTALLRDGVVR